MTDRTHSFCLHPAQFRLDGGAMYGIIPRPLWQKVSPPDELNRIELSLRLWLIQTPEKNILVDTGIGDYHDQSFNERFAVTGADHPIEGTLQTIGLSAEKVTDLIISHLHFDHVGGIGKMVGDQLIPVFPNATVHLHKKHYEYSLNPTARDQGSFQKEHYLPLIELALKEGKLQWHDGESGELISFKNGSIRFQCSMGHTPWLMHPYTDKYIYGADLIPTANHISIPWVMGYDIAPGQTTKDKQKFLEKIARENLILIFEHDIKSWGARIEVCQKKGFKIKELFPSPTEVAYRLDEAAP